MQSNQLLNLGCGKCYHPAWINVDFKSCSESVLAYDLKKGIPFESNKFDIVYHSHVLEHFTKEEAITFIKECHRVLKPNAIIRIAVPDLEVIVRQYLKNLEGAWSGNNDAMINYEWNIIELLDQITRNYSGGELAKYLFQDVIPNEEYVYSRIGQEGKNLRNLFLSQKKENFDAQKTINNTRQTPILNRIYCKIRAYFKKEKTITESEKIGNFRLSGEIHQWMYDKYSLSKLLSEVGFKNIKIQNANESYFEQWETYLLDTLPNGETRKPDSLFIEALK